MVKKSTIHNTLRNEANQQPIPQGMQWDQMQEGILSKLDHLENTAHDQRPKHLYIKACLFVVGFLVVGIALYLMEDTTSGEVARKDVQSHLVQYNDHQIEFNTNTNPEEIDNDLILKESFLAHSQNTINNTTSTQTKKANNIEAQPQGKSSLVTTDNIQKVEISTQTKSLAIPVQRINTTNDLNTKTSSVVNQVVKDALTVNRQEGSPITPEKTPVDGQRSITESLSLHSQFSNNLQIETINPLARMGSVKLVNESVPSFDFEAKELSYDYPKSISKWQIALGAGITDWLPNFTGGELATIKNKNEKGILSYGTDLSISYSLNDAWSLSSGVQYMSNESRFTHYYEEDTTVQLTVVNEVEVNMISGELMRQRLSIEDFPTINWHRVEHYNKYQSLSIPLLLSRTMAVRPKVSLDVGLGIKYSVWSQSTGRTIEENNPGEAILIVHPFESGHYKFNHQLSALGAINVFYALSDRWALGIGLQADYSITDVSLINSYSFKPSRMYSSLRAAYNF